MPKRFISNVIARFATRQAYNLYPDILPFLKRVQSLPCPPIVGVITNSDYRVPAILCSLGLRVKTLRYGSGGGSRHDLVSIRTKTQRRGITGEITFVTTSYDAGVEKPHRAIFDAARELAGGILKEKNNKFMEGRMAMEEEELSPEKCMHIGNDLNKDYLGARDAGWQAVLLTRDKRRKKKKPRSGDGEGEGMKENKMEKEDTEKNETEKEKTEEGETEEDGMEEKNNHKETENDEKRTTATPSRHVQKIPNLNYFNICEANS